VSAYLGASETLNMLMQQHNIKEENMLYPMADRAMGADGEAVIHSMQAVEK
jgi:iron-sulfur cluster repair protein YtfE (RIC family)